MGRKKDESLLLADLTGLRKRENGRLIEFNQWFFQAYNKLPTPVRLMKPCFYYVDQRFWCSLQFHAEGKRLIDLAIAYALVCSLEKNLVSFGKPTSFDSNRSEARVEKKEKHVSHDPSSDRFDQLF